jgi:hypothetical protein
VKLEDGLLEVVKVVEHEDGGATYTFDMTDQMSDICGALGLKLLMYCGALDKSPTFVFDWLGLMLVEKQTKEKQLGELVAEKHIKEDHDARDNDTD